MAVQTVPTKGNLMNTKKSLALAKNGYELLDRKRNILIREMMTLIDHANAIQQKIDDAYAEAYTALQTANVTNGFCEDISNAIPYENGLKLDSRSVMGVEIPILTIEEREDHHYLHYGLRTTNSAIDKVYTKFTEVKNLTSLPSYITLPVVGSTVNLEGSKASGMVGVVGASGNVIVPDETTSPSFNSEILPSLSTLIE